MSIKNTNFYCVGVSYKKADISVRSKFSITKENQVRLLEEAKHLQMESVVVLSTCNRTEVYGFAEHPFQLIMLLCKYSGGSMEEFARVLYVQKSKAAITHLFRLATGLESQILGDYEIVGQLKQAFKQTKELKISNAYTERLFNLVFQASKKVKNETKLSSGTTSVSYAAVQYIVNNVSDYTNRKTLVYGLGKIGKHTCKNLLEYANSKSLTLINRTEEKVNYFVKDYPQVRKGNYENLNEEVNNSDILIVSTGADFPTITKENLQGNKSLIILDLSVPANVSKEVKELSNVTYVNVDELSKVTDETLAIRKKEVPVAEGIIENYKEEFKEWLNHRKFVPAINALKQSLETIQQNEINFHKKKIQDFDVDQAEAITNRFIQKITTQFVKHLKEEDTSINQSIQVMAKVFGTNLETIDAENH